MPGSSLLKVGWTAKGFVARIEGRGTLQESTAFQAFVCAALDGDPDAVLLLDLQRCNYLDSTFLGCLVGLAKRYSQEDPRRFIIAATPLLRDQLLAPTRLDQNLPLVETAAPEVASWSILPATPTDAREMGRHAMECHQRLAELGGPQAGAFREIAERLGHDLGTN